jgi:hypothetical protein
MKLNTNLVPVLGKVPGKFGFRPMMLDLNKIDFIVPCESDRSEPTRDSVDMHAYLTSGTQVIFRVKAEDGEAMPYRDVEAKITEMQNETPTVAVRSSNPWGFKVQK